MRSDSTARVVDSVVRRMARTASLARATRIAVLHHAPAGNERPAPAVGSRQRRVSARDRRVAKGHHLGGVSTDAIQGYLDGERDNGQYALTLPLESDPQSGAAQPWVELFARHVARA